MRLIIWAVIAAPSSAEACKRMESTRDRHLSWVGFWQKIRGQDQPIPFSAARTLPSLDGGRAGEDACVFEMPKTTTMNHLK